MESLLIIVLAVLGATFIVGGIIGYRKSKGALAKAISAAAIAAGIVMRAIIIFVVPATRAVGS